MMKLVDNFVYSKSGNLLTASEGITKLCTIKKHSDVRAAQLPDDIQNRSISTFSISATDGIMHLGYTIKDLSGGGGAQAEKS